jgi:predicted nucleic acid-binding protein
VSGRFGDVKASLERRGEVIEDLDIATAAHALAHEAVLVTGDRSHEAGAGPPARLDGRQNARLCLSRAA